MKPDIPAYKAAISEITPLAQRLVDGKGTFDMQKFLSANQVKLAGRAMALRGVLCHVPNSGAPERAFSILNDSVGGDQASLKADLKELLIMRQYNERGRM